jgi:hypothetical protein
VYAFSVKKTELEKRLGRYGWWKYEEGKKHSKWTNGEMKTTVPRHREINVLTAKEIVKLAKNNQGTK